MKGPRSIYSQLKIGFMQTSLLSGLALAIFLIVDLDKALHEHFADVPWPTELLDVLQHVLMPLLVLLVPMYWGVRLVVHSALAPLAEAAQRIDAARGTERGFQVETAGLPVEVLPFVCAVNSLLGRRDQVARQREAFTAEVAHELKTPLAIVLLELERMATPDAARIKNDIKGIGRLLDQMLVMAQLEVYALAPLEDAPVSLLDIASDVVMHMAPAADTQGRYLALEARGEAMVYGRREVLVAAVRNLVENALRVTPSDSAVTVVVGPGKRIHVRDGGPGLSQDELACLSQPFTRASHPSVDGAGLGLAIVSQIMAYHGGVLGTDPRRRELSLSWPESDTDAAAPLTDD